MDSKEIFINPQQEASVCQILSFMICYDLVTKELSEELSDNYYIKYYTTNKTAIDSIKKKLTNEDRGIEISDLLSELNKLPIKFTIPDLNMIQRDITNPLLNGTVYNTIGMVMVIDKTVSVGFKNNNSDEWKQFYRFLFDSIKRFIATQYTMYPNKPVLVPLTHGATGYCVAIKGNKYYFVDTHGSYGPDKNNKNRGVVYTSTNIDSFIDMFDTLIADNVAMGSDIRAKSVTFSVCLVNAASQQRAVEIPEEKKEDDSDTIDLIINQIKELNNANTLLNTQLDIISREPDKSNVYRINNEIQDNIQYINELTAHLNILLNQGGGGGQYYYHKYMKYKQKYLNLKSKLN